LRIPVVYSQVMVADSGHEVSPSASKPGLVAAALKAQEYAVDIVAPEPVSVEDFIRVHDPRFVKAVLEGREDNGFGNRSPEVAASLPYTTGSLLTACKIALGPSRPMVVASLSSGFHHARFAKAADFCTFNGLMVTAAYFLSNAQTNGRVKRVAILDADYHYGDGTDEILDQTGLRANVFHLSFGQEFKRPDQVDAFFARLDALEQDLLRFEPQVILYQAGADAHIDDPLGGFLTTEQMGARDEKIFSLGKKLGIPIVFNLAGGYQRDADGGISKVVRLHLNTFSAALRVHDTGT
jgi:acetoin utilization deacetylase AcuC-like enzyme